MFKVSVVLKYCKEFNEITICDERLSSLSFNILLTYVWFTHRGSD